MFTNTAKIKRSISPNVGGNVEQLELLHCEWELKRHGHFRTCLAFITLQIHLPVTPQFYSSIYSREMKTGVHTKLCA